MLEGLIKLKNRWFTFQNHWLDKTKYIILPGFNKQSLHEVGGFFIQGLQKNSLDIRSSAISFKFFLALFPGILFIFTLLPFLFANTPYLPNQNYNDFLMQELQNWLPKDAYSVSKETIFDILSNKREGLLSLSFLLTIYFATDGFTAIIFAFNQSIHIEEKRSVFAQRLTALGLMFLFVILLFVSTVLTVFGDIGFDFLLAKGWMIEGLSFYLLKISNILLIVALIYFSISFLYYYAPSKRTYWNFFSTGSAVATFLIVLVSSGFAWYVNNFGQFNKLYGSIGTLIVIMIWMNMISTILLIGFELNASIKNAVLND
jgi:membrane protein